MFHILSSIINTVEFCASERNFVTFFFANIFVISGYNAKSKNKIAV